MSARLVVFSGKLDHSVRQGIAELDAAIPDLQWLVLLHAPRKPLKVLLRNQWRNFKRNGWRWIPYQAADVMDRIAQRLRRRPERDTRGLPGGELTRAALEAKPNLRLIEVPDLHAEGVLAQVRDFGADLGLSLAPPILKAKLFGLPRLGTLNVHKGRLPQFRGMPPAFWELWHDQPEVGCSIHWMTEALDAGDLVQEATVRRERFSTPTGLRMRLDEVGVGLMTRAVKDVLAGTAQSRVQPAEGAATYRKPTLAQEAELVQRLNLPKPGGQPLVRAVKDVAASLMRRIGAPMLAASTPRVTVLIFHRVTDEVRDNLTVGVEQFDRQMGLLSRHFDVLTLDQVLSGEPLKHGSRPKVAVTFDDGYLDNFELAAPILRRHGIPAAFFVSTGKVGVNGRFPHDLVRGNPPIPTMDWDQLRQMRDWGFDIGSHTVSHIDCAAEPEETVREELAASRDTLRRELGIDKVVFAYPYGKRHNMTPERLELVREAGYSGCLSAYGGCNVGRVDTFNVLRTGCHWEHSDEVFLLHALGLR